MPPYDPSLPRLALLTTGGTIASAATERNSVTGYALHGAGPQALLDAVPELAAVARIEAEAFSDIASPNADTPFMLRLARRVSALLAQDDLAGAVVTHGTDTLEETAFLLHLTVRSPKPVVVTGAMRPASALSADGPMNLLAAATVAADPASRGRGALVVLGDRIHSARLVRKADASVPGAFAGGELGVLAAGRPVFTAAAAGRHTVGSALDAARDTLPEVALLALDGDTPGWLFDAVLAARPAGLVLACTGNGSLSEPHKGRVEQLLAAGIAVVRASRTLGGVTAWEGLPGLPAGVHTPQKARLLLALALAAGIDPATAFAEY